MDHVQDHLHQLACFKAKMTYILQQLEGIAAWVQSQHYLIGTQHESTCFYQGYTMKDSIRSSSKEAEETRTKESLQED